MALTSDGHAGPTIRPSDLFNLPINCVCVFLAVCEKHWHRSIIFKYNISPLNTVQHCLLIHTLSCLCFLDPAGPYCPTEKLVDGWMLFNDTSAQFRPISVLRNLLTINIDQSTENGHSNPQMQWRCHNYKYIHSLCRDRWMW